MLRFLAVAPVLFFWGMVGCKGVKPSDVTGMWIMTDESRQRFLQATQQKAAAKIVLDPNGTFAASEIPEDLLYGPPEVGIRLVTGNGVWRLESREGKERIQLDFEAITVGQRGRVPYGTHLNVSSGWSAVSLFYFQGGDADQGRRIDFEKK